jgi:hypothetical protein
MKSIILVILLFFSMNSFGRKEIHSFEILSSYRTHHYSKLNADRFANKVSADGRTINNPLYAISFLSQYTDSLAYSSFSLFGGQDSIGSPMYGFLLSGGLGSIKGTGLQFGPIWGLYFYDEQAWRDTFSDRAERTPSWLVAYYGEEYNGINMVFGVELNLQIELSENVHLKFKNNFTPMISNHSIGLGFNY